MAFEETDALAGSIATHKALPRFDLRRDLSILSKARDVRLLTCVLITTGSGTTLAVFLLPPLSHRVKLRR